MPLGKDENDNEETRRWGTPREFDFEPLDHVDLGNELGMMDYEMAANMAGSRFVVMHGGLARLHRALSQFMLDLHTRAHGYEETIVPVLLNPQALYATGQLPKFADDQFVTRDDPPYYLAPTAEVPLTKPGGRAHHRGRQFADPKVAHTVCFRREAGSYGQGYPRHDPPAPVRKVELVHIVQPDQSYQALEALTGHAEAVLQNWSCHIAC